MSRREISSRAVAHLRQQAIRLGVGNLPAQAMLMAKRGGLADVEEPHDRPAPSGYDGSAARRFVPPRASRWRARKTRWTP